MDSEQSETVAEALLCPGREAQEAAQRHKEERRRKLASRRRGALSGLVGCAIGSAIGYALFGQIFPAGLVGMSLGFALHYLVERRAA